MDWNTTKTTAFIKDYRSSPELWNNIHASYKDRSVRSQKIKQLASKYDCTASDVKGKIKNLRSAFHREHRRITNPKNGTSHKEKKWFAYDLLAFLLDIDTPMQFLPTEDISEDDSDFKYDTISDLNPIIQADETTNLSINEGSATPRISTKKKRKKSEGESSYSKRDEETYSLFQHGLERDEFATYGEHVGNELRDLNPRARIIVKHLINNILYEAAMGKYNNHRLNEGTTMNIQNNC